jgi:(p)ppGpp synthase/HD superfamily hydrolase
MPPGEFTRAEKDALLARGEPFVMHPREVAKATKAYQTDPEILLACIIVSGTQDTGEIIKTEINLTHGLKTTADELAAYHAFRRVWQSPTPQERSAVLQWAERIAKASRRPHRAGFQWRGPS